MKFCKACSESKPLSEFYALPHTSDGLNWRCIPCQNAYNREYNRERSRKRWLARCHPDVLRALRDRTPEERLKRLATKIRVTDHCWEWTGARYLTSGYGFFWMNRRVSRLAHRVVYESAVGPIPEGLTLDHLCRNRGCVNPAHLEPVTGVENTMRGISLWAVNARKTHCMRGHEFTAENTIQIKTGSRRCRECQRLRNRAYRRGSRLT